MQHDSSVQAARRIGSNACLLAEEEARRGEVRNVSAPDSWPSVIVTIGGGGLVARK